MPSLGLALGFHTARVGAEDHQLGDLLLQQRQLADADTTRLNCCQRCLSPVPEPHLVVALNPGETDPADVLCSAPDRVPTAPAGAELSVLAVFCQGGEVVNAVREAGRVAGPTDRNFERLLWRTAGALFPDDYAETYGFGILPRWLDFGIGGSFGGG
jgi:hypothetical protein